MPRRLSDFAASISSLMLLPCRQVCMNCLAWFKLKSSRVALPSPIWRMRCFLFHNVFDRVRCGMETEISPPLKAFFATSSARSIILPRVALSRSLILLFTLDVFCFLAMLVLEDSLTVIQFNNAAAGQLEEPIAVVG